MLNIAVINLRDIGKYLSKGIILIGIIIIFLSIYNNFNFSKNINIEFLNGSFVECLDLTIPGIKQIEFETKKDETPITQKILGLEFSLTKSVKLPDGTNEEINKLSEEDKEELMVSDIPENIKTEIVENVIKPKYTNEYKNVQIKNETDFAITEEMLTPNLALENYRNVLIYHTHTCESYTTSNEYSYQMTGNYRTTDSNFNVVRVR